VAQTISKMLVVSRLAFRMANASNGLLYDDQTAIAGPVEGAWNHTALGLAGIMDLQPENAGNV